MKRKTSAFGWNPNPRRGPSTGRLKVMTTQARKRRTNKKRTARRAKAHDRRLLAKAAEEQAEGKEPPPAPQTPAQIIGEAKTRARQAACYEGGTPESHERLEAAEQDADVLVPIRIGMVCRIIGVDCKPDNLHRRR